MIAGGRMNWTEFALGAATLAVIFSIEPFKACCPAFLSRSQARRQPYRFLT
jgi:hypothetical protein